MADDRKWVGDLPVNKPKGPKVPNSEPGRPFCNPLPIWVCSCTYINLAHRTWCAKCSAPKGSG